MMINIVIGAATFYLQIIFLINRLVCELSENSMHVICILI